MNQDLEQLVFQSFDFHLDMHQDAMTMETYQLVASRFNEFKMRLKENNVSQSDEIDEIIGLIAEYISWLTYHHSFTGDEPHPPYRDLEKKIVEAEMLLGFIKTFAGVSAKITNKCAEYISNAKRLYFPFNYRNWLLHRNYFEGHVTALEVSKGMAIRFFSDYEPIFERDKPPKLKNFYVRIGQKAPQTKLFEFEYRSGWPHGEISLYLHQSRNRKKIADFKNDDFWIYKDEKNAPHFSVNISNDIWVIIGNVGSEMGVYLQKGDLA